MLEVDFGREKHDAHSHFNWRDCYGRVASCDLAGVDPMVTRKELVDISGQGLCGGWKTRNCHKRSRRSPETWTAGGPTLRGWRDLLNKSQRLLLGDLGPLRPAGAIAAPPTRPPNRRDPMASALARPSPDVGAFARFRARPDFHRLARRRIEKALASKAPVRSRRSVERAPLIAALTEDKPDQKERKTEADGQAKRDHDTGSITAAVP